MSRSFLYILSIVLGTFGYGFLDTKLKICDQYLILMRKDDPNSFIENLFLRTLLQFLIMLLYL